MVGGILVAGSYDYFFLWETHISFFVLKKIVAHIGIGDMMKRRGGQIFNINNIRRIVVHLNGRGWLENDGGRMEERGNEGEIGKGKKI